MRARHPGPRTPARPGPYCALLLPPACPEPGAGRLRPRPSAPPRALAPECRPGLVRSSRPPPSREHARRPLPRGAVLVGLWPGPSPAGSPAGPELGLGVFGHRLGPARWRGGGSEPGGRAGLTAGPAVGAQLTAAAGKGLPFVWSGLSGRRRGSGLGIPLGSPAAAAWVGSIPSPPFLAGVGPCEVGSQPCAWGWGRGADLCHLEPEARAPAWRTWTRGSPAWHSGPPLAGSRAAGGRRFGSRPGAVSFLCKSIDPPRHPQPCSCLQSCPPPPCRPLRSFGGWRVEYNVLRTTQTPRLFTLQLCGEPH